MRFSPYITFLQHCHPRNQSSSNSTNHTRNPRNCCASLCRGRRRSRSRRSPRSRGRERRRQRGARRHGHGRRGHGCVAALRKGHDGSRANAGARCSGGAGDDGGGSRDEGGRGARGDEGGSYESSWDGITDRGDWVGNSGCFGREGEAALAEGRSVVWVEGWAVVWVIIISIHPVPS